MPRRTKIVATLGPATHNQEIVNAMPGQHGGNLDDHLHGIGTKIYFPVRQPGGMFSIASARVHEDANVSATMQLMTNDAKRDVDMRLLLPALPRARPVPLFDRDFTGGSGTVGL